MFLVRGLCDEPINRTDESCRQWCDQGTSLRRSRSTGAVEPWEKMKYLFKIVSPDLVKATQCDYICRRGFPWLTMNLLYAGSDSLGFLSHSCSWAGTHMRRSWLKVCGQQAGITIPATDRPTPSSLSLLHPHIQILSDHNIYEATASILERHTVFHYMITNKTEYVAYSIPASI
jgi:hypothetical protein